MEAIDLLLAAGSVILLSFAIQLFGIAARLYGPIHVPDESRSEEFKLVEGVTVVVPYRNEADNLPALIESLQSVVRGATIPMEVILVDDHSSDGYRPTLPEGGAFLALEGRPGEQGKKAAIDRGVSAAKYPWILGMDADSRPDPAWFRAVESQVPKHAELFVFLIRPLPRRTAVTKFFDLEFLALQGVGMATALGGNAILANGAAMMYRKDAYEAAKAERRDQSYASGDDVFLLTAVKKIYGRESVAFLAHPGRPYMNARFPSRFGKLFAQRLRWISKNPAVPDVRYKWTMVLTFLGNFLWFPLAFALYTRGYEVLFQCALFVKLLPEILILTRMAVLTKRGDCLPWLIPSAIIYPVYLCILVAFGFFTRGKFVHE